MMKVGLHLLNFFYYPKPYVDDPQSNVAWLPHPAQREAWLQHSACVGVDYLNDGETVERAYAVLAQLIAEILDENCAGLYVERERRLIPHDKLLYLELKKLGSACDSGVTPKKAEPQPQRGER